MTDPRSNKSFFELTVFPRSKHSATDDGTKRKPMRQKFHCPVCNGRIFETVSLEFCNTCGYVQTDYWYNLDEK